MLNCIKREEHPRVATSGVFDFVASFGCYYLFLPIGIITYYAELFYKIPGKFSSMGTGHDVLVHFFQNERQKRDRDERETAISMAGELW